MDSLNAPSPDAAAPPERRCGRFAALGGVPSAYPVENNSIRVISYRLTKIVQFLVAPRRPPSALSSRVDRILIHPHCPRSFRVAYLPPCFESFLIVVCATYPPTRAPRKLRAGPLRSKGTCSDPSFSISASVALVVVRPPSGVALVRSGRKWQV